MQIQIQHNHSGQSGQAYDVRGVVVGTYAKVGTSWNVSWDGKVATIARTQKGAIETLEYIASKKEQAPMTPEQLDAAEALEATHPDDCDCQRCEDALTCDACGGKDAITYDHTYFGNTWQRNLCERCADATRNDTCDRPTIVAAGLSDLPFLDVAIDPCMPDDEIVQPAWFNIRLAARAAAIVTAAGGLALALCLTGTPTSAQELPYHTGQAVIINGSDCRVNHAWEDGAAVAHCRDHRVYSFDPDAPAGQGSGWNRVKQTHKGPYGR